MHRAWKSAPLACSVEMGAWRRSHACVLPAACSMGAGHALVSMLLLDGARQRSTRHGTATPWVQAGFMQSAHVGNFSSTHNRFWYICMARSWICLTFHCS